MEDVIFRSIRISNVASNWIGVYLLQCLAALLFLAAFWHFWWMSVCCINALLRLVRLLSFISYFPMCSPMWLLHSSSSCVTRCSEKEKRLMFYFRPGVPTLSSLGANGKHVLRGEMSASSLLWLLKLPMVTYLFNIAWTSLCCQNSITL